jgi:hypothetical protein
VGLRQLLKSKPCARDRVPRQAARRQPIHPRLRASYCISDNKPPRHSTGSSAIEA